MSNNNHSNGSENVSRPLVVQPSNYHTMDSSQLVAENVEETPGQLSVQHTSKDNNKRYEEESSNEDEETHLLESANQQQVHSRRNTRQTYITFLYLGFLALIPWCMFINAFEYFRIRFQDSAFADNFASYISFGYTASSMITMGFAVAHQHQANKTRGIIVFSSIIAIVFMVVAVVTQLDSLDPNHCFYIIFSAAVVAAVSSAIMQVYSFAIVTWFPPINIQATLNGQAVAGLLPSILQLISAINGVKDPTLTDKSNAGTRTFIVFTCAAISSAMVIEYFIRFINSATYHQYKAEHESSIRKNTIEDEDNEEEEGTSGEVDTTTADVLSNTNNNDERHSLVSVDRLPFPVVIRKIWRPALSVWFIFTVTIALFPAITSKVIPSGHHVTQYEREVFVAVHFLLFNFGDWCGRMVPALIYVKWLHRHTYLLVASLLRIVFVPAILLLTNIQDPNRWYDPLLSSSTLFLMILGLLAITNGWFTSMSFLNAPHLVDRIDRPLASTTMNFALVIGLASGSAFSFLMQAIVCGCNPFITD
ncbi:nucleoside transporter-domain-containing protein [Syncephalis plumigaleata]|nr:nucleoside transporter-domain-containing protein [Syncephalis plumigaleata]